MDINERKSNLSQSPNELGEKEIGKLLLGFSIPAIIGMLCNAMQNIINRIFVGNAVGSVAIGAVTICFPIMVIFMALSMLIGIGGTTLTAIRLGQQRKDGERPKFCVNSK